MSKKPQHDKSTASSTAGGALVLAALGVVFGDIGTSPLYAVQTIFERSAIRPVAIDRASVYGVISVIFWSITLIVTILYVSLLTRADNDGEGGLLSLLSLLQQQKLSRRALGVLVTLGILGAALFFGDSMITPAISVLSSVEGLEIVDSGLKDFVVPAAVAILVGLLVVQRWGTARVGKLFGPVMAVWFAAIALCGVNEIVRAPAILQALSPHWAVRYFVANPLTAFLSLGGVVLVVTGAEALYADLGHVGRKPIVTAWLALVFPAVTLNYLGQGALLLRTPKNVHNPFFLLAPHWARMPMVALATLAAIIASQAVISGAFSVTRQAARLRYVPYLRVIHTSSKEPGQIYLPFVNWTLLVAVVALVVSFRSSSRLAAAYGLADIGTISVSTLLFFALVWARRRWPQWQVIAVGAVFLLVVLAFLVANSVKIAEGGWLPISIAAVLFVVLTSWRRGRVLRNASRNKMEGKLSDLVDELQDGDAAVQRVPGCAVYLSRGEGRGAVGDADQRRAQPRAAEQCGPADPRDDILTTIYAGRAGLGRRPGVRRRRDLPRHRSAGLSGPPQHPGSARGGARRGAGVDQGAHRGGELLRVGPAAAGYRRPRHGPMAQAPLRHHLAAHHGPGRVPRPAPRAHGRGRRAYRHLSAAPEPSAHGHTAPAGCWWMIAAWCTCDSGRRTPLPGGLTVGPVTATGG